MAQRPMMIDQEPQQPVKDLTHGTWAAAFIDYEHRDRRRVDGVEVASSNKVTGGAMAGIDWTFRDGYGMDESRTFGFFGGGSKSHTSSGSAFLGAIPAVNSPDSVAEITGGSEDVYGGFWGAYALFRQNSYSLDSLVKIDHLAFDSSSHILERATACGFPGLPVVASLAEQSADILNVTLAANVQRRFELSSSSWWEPTAGFQFTYSNFYSVSGSLHSRSLNDESFDQNDPNGPRSASSPFSSLDDGQRLRLQLGARYGRTDRIDHSYIWTNIVTGLVYSDVYVNGFVVSSTGGNAAEDDEGKLRVLGMLETRLRDTENDVTYFGEVQVRGGEDLLGVGGKVGIRYEW